ncbi:MAG: N-acetylmuramoyl-L-alanine amidase, partial [Parasporobacterium sp.]|nr:N-acetylmuramoyl-L-alanine amidase [Parasporobacterium sp.]
GVPVYMTRYDSMAGQTTYNREERADIALSYNAKYLISCHNNAYFESSHGVEVIIPNSNGPNGTYHHNEGVGLANALLSNLTAMGIADRGYYTRDSIDDEDGIVYYDDGSVADYYGINYHAKLRGITGIIIEHAFVTNEADYWGFLSTEDKLAALGRADAQAIASYLGLK